MKPRVLIVDDERSMCELLETDLKLRDFDVLWHTSAEEAFATVLIVIGVVMLMQPYAMVLYTYSFAVILVGTIGFVVVSHFPE